MLICVICGLNSVPVGNGRFQRVIRKFCFDLLHDGVHFSGRGREFAAVEGQGVGGAVGREYGVDRQGLVVAERFYQLARVASRPLAIVI